MVILDIETVPEDLDTLIKYNRYLKEKNTYYLEQLKSKFPEENADVDDFIKIKEINEDIIKTASLDPLMGRIACIGIIHKEKKQRVARTFFDRESEENLLISFWDYIRDKKLECKTVTFNGLNFDLPFLFFRSMKYGIEIPWHDVSLRKFTAFPHFDIMQHMSFWRSFGYKSLDYIARFFGYECDPENDPSGGDVYKWWCAGMDSEIQTYNIEDCNKTAYVFNYIHKYYSQAPKPMNG